MKINYTISKPLVISIPKNWHWQEFVSRLRIFVGNIIRLLPAYHFRKMTFPENLWKCQYLETHVPFFAETYYWVLRKLFPTNLETRKLCLNFEIYVVGGFPSFQVSRFPGFRKPGNMWKPATGSGETLKHTRIFLDIFLMHEGSVRLGMLSEICQTLCLYAQQTFTGKRTAAWNQAGTNLTKT